MNKIKTIKLVVRSIWTILVLMVSVFLSVNFYSQSASQNFKLATNVLDEWGGGSGSDKYFLSISTGGQPSVVGKMKSTNFEARSGYVFSAWVYNGDANADGNISLSDPIRIANYIFSNGPQPKPMEAGDCNCDTKISLSDVIYLAKYILQGGPPPCSAKPSSGTGGQLAKLNPLSPISGSAQVGLVSPQSSYDEFVEIPIFAKFDVDLAGAQFEIEYEPEKLELLEPSLTPRSKGMELLSSTKDKIQKIGVLDFKVENYIRAGEGNIVILKIKGKDWENLKIKEAILVDRDANEIPVEIITLAKGEEEKSQALPKSFSLSQNYPNPFNPLTTIEYALPQDCQVKITIYNILGQKVKTLVDDYQTAGYKSVLWDGKDSQGNEIASGIYFYRIRSANFADVKKMVVTK